MEVEEHFAFKATCDHEDNDKYNVYPTCEGATLRTDKNEEEFNKKSHSDDSDAEDSDYDSEADEDSDYDPKENMSPADKDHSRSPTPQLPEPDTATEAKTTNIEMQPKIIENPDLTVTFSDDEVIANNIVLLTQNTFSTSGGKPNTGSTQISLSRRPSTNSKTKRFASKPRLISRPSTTLQPTIS